MSDNDEEAAEAKAKRAEGSAVKRTAEERAWDIRRSRMRRIAVQFAVAVGLPTLCAIIYYGFWAADEFESDTVIVVQSPRDSADALGAGNFETNRADDVGLVQGAIQSRAMLAALIDGHGWREHYRAGGNVFSSLGDTGSETEYSYYRDRVSLIGKKGAPMRLRVRAFNPEMARSLGRAMLDLAAKNVNEVALRPIAEQLELARSSLAAAQARLDEKGGDDPAPPAGAVDASIKPGAVDATPRALSAVERARLELDEARQRVSALELHLAGQRRYITIVSGPSMPDEARYPRRLWGIATVFVVSMALMGIFSLLLGALREHAKV